jgi:hypothetical protein
MAKIQLTQGKDARFDDADASTVLQHKWFAVRLGGAYFYAATKIDGVRVLMHRLLLGLAIGDEAIVDHIDGDGLNNCRANIRLASHAINQRNRRRNRNNKTGVSGLVFRPTHGSAGTWVATAMIDGRLRTKTFGCLRRGHDEARRLAVEWRKQHEAKYGITVREGVAA